MKNRTAIINHLISTNNYQSYLEIGTQTKINFNNINCSYKICVDPAKHYNTSYDFNMTSDEFFAQNTEMFDIIFIDGLHLADQVEKDILNFLDVLNEGGSIVLHDTNPATEFYQLQSIKASSQTPAGGAWNGTVWKAIFKLRKTREDLIFKTYPFDFGVTVIQRGNGELLSVENPYYEYSIFDNHRKEILNIVEIKNE